MTKFPDATPPRNTPSGRTLDTNARAKAIGLARKAARSQAGKPPQNSSASSLRYGFKDLENLKNMRIFVQVGTTLGIEDPYFRLHDGHAKTTSVVNGRQCLNFSSYDYLGLNADPRLSAAAHAAIDRYGISASASRMVAGDRPVHRAFEAALSQHYGSEDALVFVSGHATNVSLIGALMGDGDLILSDRFIHNSITTGAQLSPASRRSFGHNDLVGLEDILQRERASYRNVLVVVEGLYSMDGDLPDLAGLIDLRDRYGFWLMVDEAHALGCVGATGRGSFEHFGIDPSQVDIWMGTLSKTLASTGGYVAGSADLIQFLKYFAAGFVFSVALPPLLAASAKCALEILHDEPWRAEKLRANSVFFQKRADALGLSTGLAQGYGVMPVVIGDSTLATKLCERLFERGVNVAPVVFPGVPMDQARLRFFLSADHSEEQIDQALTATREELDRLAKEGFTESVAQAAAKFRQMGPGG